MNKNDIVTQFMEESVKFGFSLSLYGEGKLSCTSRCNHCGDTFTQFIDYKIVGGQVQCKLPIYCFDCTKNAINKAMKEMNKACRRGELR